MPGGLFQLTAIAKEDIYLNVNPQLSYFRSVYSQYSNFAKITYNINIDNTNNDKSLFDTETISNIKLPDNGDLIKDFYINVTLPRIYCDFEKYTDIRWTSDLPFKIIKNIKFSMGGRIIQEFDSEFLYSYYNISLGSEEYENLLKILSDHKIRQVSGDLLNNNYKSDNTYYNKKINNLDYKLTNKYYKQGFFKDSIDLSIPIPVWFNECPFPIHALKYMDINVSITFRALNELIIYQKKTVIINNDITKLFQPEKNIWDLPVIDLFIRGKSSLLLDLYGKFNSDVYKIPEQYYRSNAMVPEYKDFNIDGYLGYNPTQPISECNNNNNKIGCIENAYIVNIPHFIDNNDKIFRQFNASITSRTDNINILEIDDTDTSASILTIIDSGIGYYIPPPFDKNDKPTIFIDSFENIANSIDNTVNNYVFKRSIVSSIYNDKLKNLLLDVFPKIVLIDKNGILYNDKFQVTEMDIKGRIIAIEIIGNLINLDDDFMKTDDNIYQLKSHNYNTTDISVEFTLFNKLYDYDDTVYRNGITNHSYGSQDKFAPLLDINIKHHGKYYIGSPDIYLYGKESNFDPTVNYQLINNSRTITSVDINSKSPIGFISKPNVKISSQKGNKGEFDCSLGVYTVWWNPFGLFRSTRDRFIDLPDFTYFDGVKKPTDPDLYNDKDIVPTKLGKPILNITTSSTSNAKLDIKIGNNGINKYFILAKGTSYVTTNNVSVNYSNSITSGSFVDIKQISTVNGGITSVIFNNSGINMKIGDILNINGGDNNAYIKITELKNGVIYDIEVINGGSYLINPINYTLSNQLEGSGALFKINTDIVVNNSISYYNVNSISILNSGKNYQGTDPIVFAVNHPLDYSGYGALFNVNIDNGTITNIYPNSEVDRGYDYTIAPSIFIYGSNSFEAHVNEFNSNGGIQSITVKSSFSWPINVIDTLFANVTNYSDENLYDSLGNKLINDYDVKYYIELQLKGPGKDARLSLTKNNFKIINGKYVIDTITIVEAGSGYNNTNIFATIGNISNSNAEGALFNITVNRDGSVSANIINSGFFYTIGDTFNIAGGKYNNTGSDNAYIEVANVNINGEITSIIVEPGVGYYDKNELGIRDYYYFYPRAMLGINRIDVIDGGSNLVENPVTKINDTELSNNLNLISYPNDFKIAISDKSIIGTLNLTDVYIPGLFTTDNIENFLIHQTVGNNLSINYNKSLFTNFEIINSGYSYNKNDIINLKLDHNFYGKDNFIIGNFKITELDEFGGILSIVPFIDNYLDLSDKYIKLYEKYNTDELDLKFYYGSSYKQYIENDNRLPTFNLYISDTGYVSRLVVTNKGRNLIKSPEYGINSSIINILNEDDDISEKLKDYDVPIIAKYDEENRNVDEFIIYMAKNYEANPEINVINLLDYKNANNAIIHTEQIQINDNKYVYKFNVVSGNGYRHKISIPQLFPNIISPISENAVLKPNIIGSLHAIEIIQGGIGFNSLDDFVWNNNEYKDIVLQPVLFEGVIKNISVIRSATIYDKDIDIKVSHRNPNYDGPPVIINCIMNYHLNNVTVINEGYGYHSDIQTSDGRKYIPINFESPCPDVHDSIDNFIKANAIAIIENCRIKEVLILSGYYMTNTNDIPKSINWDITVDVLGIGSASSDDLNVSEIEKNIQWIRIGDIWHVTDLILQFRLPDEIIQNNNFSNHLDSEIDSTTLLRIKNTDSLFTEGKNVAIKLEINNSIQAGSVDTAVLNTKSNYDDEIFILDNTNLQELNSINPVDIYNIDFLFEKNLVIAKFRPVKIESETIYSVIPTKDTEFNIKNILNSINSHLTDADLKIKIEQEPNLIAKLYPYFDYGQGYNTIDFDNNIQLLTVESGTYTQGEIVNQGIITGSIKNTTVIPLNSSGEVLVKILEGDGFQVTSLGNEVLFNSVEKNVSIVEDVNYIANIDFIEITESTKTFEEEGILGYNGGGLFDSNIIMESGITEFIRPGDNDNDINQKPNYDVEPFYKHDIINHYKPKYLEIYNYYNNNGFLQGDDGSGQANSHGNENNDINDGTETGAIIKFNEYLDYILNRDENVINNNFGSIINTEFTVLNAEDCTTKYKLNNTFFQNNYRGSNFYSKPYIMPNGSYNKPNNLSINLSPYSVLNNLEDYLNIFGNNINSYKQTISLDYIYLDKIELENILLYNQSYFIPCYNKLVYNNIYKNTKITYETFGSTKDIIILPRRSDHRNRSEFLNFTDLECIDNMKLFDKFKHNNYLNNIIKNRNSEYNSSNYIDNFTYTKEITSFMDNITLFINNEPGDIIINNYDLNIVDDKLNKNYITYNDGIDNNYIKILHEYWKFKEPDDIPIIDGDNFNKYTPDIIQDISLSFNNMIREEYKNKYYYQDIQKYENYSSNTDNGVYLYSFAKKPLSYLPTGTCNFSHINKVHIGLNIKQPHDNYTYDILIYNRYYNILNIKSGIGELMFYK